MKTFTPENLAVYNGKDGRPAYIVHENRVIDVSGSKLWKTGTHMKRHPAGRDLTTDIHAAPHGVDVLDRYPQVGVLEKEAPEAPREPAFLSRLLGRFPMLRRHPHPMTVHFPIVFMTAATCFSLLFLITKSPAFETTAFHCLGGGVLFTVVAILTGVYTWWLNYLATPSRPIRMKLVLSPVLFATSAAAFFWRLTDPTVLTAGSGMAPLYLVLVLVLFPLVAAIGWFGAQLTFPHEG